MGEEVAVGGDSDPVVWELVEEVFEVARHFARVEEVLSLEEDSLLVLDYRLLDHQVVGEAVPGGDEVQGHVQLGQQFGSQPGEELLQAEGFTGGEEVGLCLEIGRAGREYFFQEVPGFSAGRQHRFRHLEGSGGRRGGPGDGDVEVSDAQGAVALHLGRIEGGSLVGVTHEELFQPVLASVDQ